MVNPAYYMKTIYRLVLVKDIQANNPTNTVQWSDVFGRGGSGLDDGTYFGASDIFGYSKHDALSGIKDITVTLDADDPMKNVRMRQGVSFSDRTGRVRDANTIGSVIPGIIRLGCRLTFTDI